ncbi:hypothetical protein J7M22_11405 [Candidatus Poribacteria bacterium]|nr:hypothetical protein [Candidatus Poribacteria bacterium]
MEAEAKPDRSPPTSDIEIAYVSGCEDGVLPDPIFGLGGLMRCASMLNKLRVVENTLLLTNGNQMMRVGMMESELYGAFLDLLRFDAVNVGPADFINVDGLIQKADELSLVSCNLFRNGKRLFPDMLVRTSASQNHIIKIAIIGIMSKEFESTVKAYTPDVEVMDVENSLSGTLNRLLPDIPLVILLAHVPSKDTVVELADKFPDIDLILFEAPGLSSISEPIKVNRTLIANAGRRSFKVLHLSLKLRRNGKGIKHYKSCLIPLSDKVPDSPLLFELIKGYENIFIESKQPQMRDKKRETSNLPDYPNTFVGSERCARCHEYEYYVWKNSQHASPFRGQNQNWKTSCLECHTTGFGFSKPEWDVGCEACHGPGGRHSIDPKSKPYGRVYVDECRKCHTDSQTLNFSYSTYWRRINH